MCRFVNMTLGQICGDVCEHITHKETGQGLVSIKLLFHSIKLMDWKQTVDNFDSVQCWCLTKTGRVSCCSTVFPHELLCFRIHRNKLFTACTEISAVILNYKTALNYQQNKRNEQLFISLEFVMILFPQWVSHPLWKQKHYIRVWRGTRKCSFTLFLLFLFCSAKWTIHPKMN